MQLDDFILADEFCSYHRVERSFVQALHQFGLIEIRSVETAEYIPHKELQKLEQMIRLHYDLNINLEGIDAITHLLERVQMMQTEITSLRNRLKLFEQFD